MRSTSLMNDDARRSGAGVVAFFVTALSLLGACQSTSPGRLDRPSLEGRANGEAASDAKALEEAGAKVTETRTPVTDNSRQAGPQETLRPAPDFLSFPRRDDRRIATIAGEPLHKSQVFDYLMTTYPDKVRGAVAVMLGNRVLGAEAAKHGIRVDSREVSQWYSEHRKNLERRARLEYGDGTTFEAWLAATYAQSESEYRRGAMDRERAKRTLSRLVRFLQLREDRVEFRLVSVADRNLAKAVEKSLRDGADFGALAKQYSVHPSSDRGGKMFPVWRGALQPDLERVVFDLSPGQIGPIITAKDQRGRDRYQIAKLLKYHRGRSVSYAEVESEILASLKAQPLSPDEWTMWQIRVERLADLDL